MNEKLDFPGSQVLNATMKVVCNLHVVNMFSSVQNISYAQSHRKFKQSVQPESMNCKITSICTKTMFRTRMNWIFFSDFQHFFYCEYNIGESPSCSDLNLNAIQPY